MKPSFVRNTSGLTAAGIVLLVLAHAAPVAARQLYTYTDSRGVVHYTDAPVDSRYKPLVLSNVQKGLWRGNFTVAYKSGPNVKLRTAPRELDRLISGVARDHGLSPALVKAVIATESNFDPNAVSPKGALGLMQLMPGTADMLGVEEPLAPDENVRGGSRYLRALLDRYDGDLSHALAAYNAGPMNVDRYGGIPPFRETREYVQRVLSYYRTYRGDVRP